MGGSKKGDVSYTSILFGNIGEDGKLDDTYDAETSAALSEGLAEGGLASLIGGLGDVIEGAKGNASAGAAVVTKSKDAVDFEDMDELADDDEPETPAAAPAVVAVGATGTVPPGYVPLDDLSAAVARAQPNFFKKPKYSVNEYEDYDEDESDEDVSVSVAGAEEDQVDKFDLSVLKDVQELTPQMSVICSTLNKGDPILKFSEMFAPRMKRRRTRKLDPEFDEDDVDPIEPEADDAEAFEKTEEEATRVNTAPKVVEKQRIFHVAPKDSVDALGIYDGVVLQEDSDEEMEDWDCAFLQQDAKPSDVLEDEQHLLEALPSERAFDGVELLPWEDEILWDGGDDESEKVEAEKAVSQVKPSTSLKEVGTWPIPTKKVISAEPSNVMDLLDVDMEDVSDLLLGLEPDVLQATKAPPSAPSASSVTKKRSTATSKVKPTHALVDSQSRVASQEFAKDYYNAELDEGDWDSRIVWDEQTRVQPAPLVFDLNDPYIMYEEQFIVKDLEEVVGHEVKRRKVPQLEPTVAVEARKAAEDAAKAPKTPSKKKTNTKKRAPDNLDPFNISVDHYYCNTRASMKKQKVSKVEVFHAPVALKLSLVKPNLTEREVLNFHRPRLFGASSRMPTIITSGREKKTDSKKLVTGRDAFKNKNDLTAREGDILLFEYLEERPLFVQNVGMASKLVNYIRRLKERDDDSSEPTFKTGETIMLEANDESPFFGDIAPGKIVHSLNNKLFRVPVAKHQPATTDFLLVVTKDRKKMYLRDIPAVYCAGQIQPMMEVYAPNSRNSAQFQKSRLKAFIYRFFKKKNAREARIRIDDLLTTFKGSSDQGVRRILKEITEYQKFGGTGGWWTLKNDVQLPTEEELQALVSPEQVCCYEAMLVGALRLKDVHVDRTTTPAGIMTAVRNAGVTEESFIKLVRLLEEELSVTPWYLSASFISAMAGKGMLRLAGNGEVFGKGESFSYVKVPQKEQQKKQKKRTVNIPKTSVTGTGSDLRKLSLENARIVLLKFGVAEATIAKLPRWKRIALVRKKSSEAAVKGDDDANLTRFARGSRYSFHQAQEEYREHRQKIFDIQLRMLRSANVDFSDSDSDEDEDETEMEKLLVNFMDTSGAPAAGATPVASQATPAPGTPATPAAAATPATPGTPGTPATPAAAQTPAPVAQGPSQWFTPAWRQKWVKKVVTIANEDGTWTRRTTIIRDVTEVEKIVTLMKQTKATAIKATVSKQTELERNRIRREKRRLQEKLRRLKKNAEKQRALKAAMIAGDTSSTPTSSTANSALTCGACGMPGHMRTNRMCPLFDEEELAILTKKKKKKKTPKKKKVTPAPSPANPLVKLEGTRLKISSSAIKTSNESFTPKVRLSFSGASKSEPPAKRRRTARAPLRTPERQEFNKMVSECIDEIVANPNSFIFREPVSKKIVPDYHLVVDNPIDLSTMSNKCKHCKYAVVQDLLDDFDLMASNCHLYNDDRNAHLPPIADMLVDQLKEIVGSKRAELDAAAAAITSGATPFVASGATLAAPAADDDDEFQVDDDGDDEEFLGAPDADGDSFVPGV